MSRLVVFCISALVAVIHPDCTPIKPLGKNPSGEALRKIESLPNYRNGAFQNLETIPQANSVSTGSRRPRWLMLFKFLQGQPKTVLPRKEIPAAVTDLNIPYEKPTVIWFGHSSFLLKTSTANILVDPNFSGYAGPFKGAIRAFNGTDVYRPKDMPVIDALIISHDHYDHLDYKTVKKLRKKVKRVIVPIGVGSHFIHWGYDPEVITELNWNESIVINQNITIIATPAHHRSNRTFETRKTLWASYVIHADGRKLYYSGDSGYSKHFKMIGERYGPFDLALLECGQYNIRWPQSHMFPPQVAQAAVDLKTKMTMPVHWGKFAESDHGWNESIRLFLSAADSLRVPVTIPLIGQPHTIGERLRQFNWWEYF